MHQLSEKEIEELLKHPSKAKMRHVIDRFLDDETFRPSIVDLAVGKNHPYSWRAAWVMKFAAREKPESWYPFLEIITEALPEMETHQQVGCFIRELIPMPLNEEQRDRLLQRSLDELEGVQEVEYSKAYAVEVLDKYVVDFPELTREFTLFIERALEYTEHAYFRNKAIKILKKWKKKYPEHLAE